MFVAIFDKCHPVNANNVLCVFLWIVITFKEKTVYLLNGIGVTTILFQDFSDFSRMIANFPWSDTIINILLCISHCIAIAPILFYPWWRLSLITKMTLSYLGPDYVTWPVLALDFSIPPQNIFYWFNPWIKLLHVVFNNTSPIYGRNGEYTYG